MSFGVEALCSSVVFAPPDCRAKRRKIDKGGVMKTRTTLAFLIALACTAYAAEVGAQVVRESDVKSIAGVVYKGGEPVGFTFRSTGGEILFASLSADIYRPSMSHEEGHDTTDTSHDEGGGCGGEDEGGGPGRFFIEVIDGMGAQVCYAERPAPPPGWMRDPRLACVLPYSGVWPVTYTVQVGLKAHEGEEQVLVPSSGKPHAFLLDLSLRKVAVGGTTVLSAASANRL